MRPEFGDWTYTNERFLLASKRAATSIRPDSPCEALKRRSLRCQSVGISSIPISNNLLGIRE